jgi:diguanylate cyclase (GGDEF)-like protein
MKQGTAAGIPETWTHYPSVEDARAGAKLMYHNDRVLRAIAQLLSEDKRASDFLARYGGEEFTLILPNASLADAYQRMEQLRNDIKRLHLQHRGKPMPQFTGSFGIAIFPEHGSTIETLLKAADEALYRAKKLGRDRIVTA